MNFFYEAEIQLENEDETMKVIVVDNHIDTAIETVKEKIKYKVGNKKYKILNMINRNAYEININRLSAGDLVRLQMMITASTLQHELSKSK